MSDQTTHRALGVTFFSIGCSFFAFGIAGQPSFIALGAAFLSFGLLGLAKSHNAH